MRTAATVKKVGIGLGFVVASYLAAGLVNASPVTQPNVAGAYSRGRVVIVAPAAAADVLPRPRPARPEAEIVPSAVFQIL